MNKHYNYRFNDKNLSFVRSGATPNIMAVGGGGGKDLKCRMLLGFPDEFMDADLADYCTSKIGGQPDWPNPGIKLWGVGQ